MNCREWEEAIALHAGGDLDARRALEVERHVAGCAGCQIFSSGLAECLETMRAGHRQEIAPAHFAAVRARVLAQLQPVPWWRRRWLRMAAVSAVACGALWLAAVNWRIHRPVPPPTVALVRPPAPPIEIARAAPAISARAVPPRRLFPRRPKPAPPEEPLTVKIETDDPDVVIYWITNPKGE